MRSMDKLGRQPNLGLLMGIVGTHWKDRDVPGHPKTEPQHILQAFSAKVWAKFSSHGDVLVYVQPGRAESIPHSDPDMSPDAVV